jgi:glycosyltransferase involved in cell wall biosynthesis
VRVAIGPTDPAGTSGALASGLRSLGVRAAAVVWSQHPFGYRADRVLGRGDRYAFALRAPFAHDVFHYQGFTWVRRFADALWARAFGRTLVVNFHGDDCRLYGVARALFPPRGRTGDPTKDALVVGRVERFARICHAAIVHDLELATYVVPRFERVYLVPPALHDAPAPVPAERDDRPVVVHAPSDPSFKGTPKIEAAIDVLRQRVPVDFRLVRDVPNHLALRELAAADAVVDQLDSVNVGVVALEAMRLGKPVLSQLSARALAPYQAGLLSSR